MIYALIYPELYIKKARKFLKKHPTLRAQYQKTLELLELNPHHPSLRLHPLKGNLKELHSISINISYRITLDMLLTEKEIILINVGDHSAVY